MEKYTRRAILGSTVGAASVLAGCSESSSSGSFTRTTVQDQELVVEFEESLKAETISVVDPAGEAFAETSLSTGVTRATFDIEMPYAPGEYRIIAADGDETLAETTHEIRPELEVVDVGIGANRMDEMPEERGRGRESEALVTVENIGSGPEAISQLSFLGDIPNPTDSDFEGIGIYNPEIPGDAHDPVVLDSDQGKTLFSSTLPFLFEGDGVECTSDPQSGEMTVSIHGAIRGEYRFDYQIKYSASESYDGCEITLNGG